MKIQVKKQICENRKLGRFPVFIMSAIYANHWAICERRKDRKSDTMNYI